MFPDFCLPLARFYFRTTEIWAKKGKCHFLGCPFSCACFCSSSYRLEIWVLRWSLKRTAEFKFQRYQAVVELSPWTSEKVFLNAQNEHLEPSLTFVRKAPAWKHGSKRNLKPKCSCNPRVSEWSSIPQTWMSIWSAGIASSAAEIFNSTFENNTADNYGGSMYITAGVTAQLINDLFRNVDSFGRSRPTIGDIIESRYAHTHTHTHTLTHSLRMNPRFHNFWL